LNGLLQQPKSLNPSTRALMAKVALAPSTPPGPKVSLAEQKVSSSGWTVRYVPEVQPVVRGRRFRHNWELAGCPIHSASINHHATHRDAMPTNPLGRGVSHDVGAPLNRPAHVPSTTKGVVNDQRNAICMGELSELLKLRHIEAWVADRLAIYGLGIVVD
jgi:hypothetical protein